MFHRYLPLILIVFILSGCRPRPSAPAQPLPGPSLKRAAARVAMKPPTPAEALLARVRNENKAINFVRPAPVSFTWRDATGTEMPVAGAEIAALIKIGTDYSALNQHVATMVGFFLREGFARDPNNSTEIIDGLSSGSTVAAIRATCPEGGGECMLSVRVGNLKK